MVVKVQRPGVAQSIDRDLDILERLADRLHRRTGWAKALGLRQLVAGFEERTREELDFRIEGTNMEAARRSLHDTDPVCIPDLLEGFTTSRVLVQGRAPGGSITSPGAFNGWDPDGREALADGLLALVLRQMLGGEQFHADPHPGNVFLRPDGRLELIDFGAVGRLDPYERAGLIDVLQALQTDDPSLMREGLLRIGTATGSVDEEALDRELARALSRGVRPDGTMNPGLFEDLLFVLRDFGILLPRSTLTLFRTLVTLLGTLEVISPGYPLVGAAQRVGTDLLGEQSAIPTTPAEFLKSAAMSNASAMRRLPQEVDAIARRLLHGDLRTRVSLLSEAEDVTVARGLVNRLVMGVVGSALALSGAVMLAADSPTFNGVRLVNTLGGITLFFAVLVLARLLVQILRDRTEPPVPARAGCRRSPVRRVRPERFLERGCCAGYVGGDLGHEVHVVRRRARTEPTSPGGAYPSVGTGTLAGRQYARPVGLASPRERLSDAGRSVTRRGRRGGAERPVDPAHAGRG